MVLLHLVAWQRPAAYVLPTTRFIPDQRTVVSRAATRPRDMLLLVLRVLMFLAAATAFARPVLTPSSGSVATIVLLDRSRVVGAAADAVARARTALGAGDKSVLVVFDTSASIIASTALDSIARAPLSNSVGSLSAGLALARRSASELAERVDSVRLVIVSPLVRAELDSASAQLRAKWPGAVGLQRVVAARDSSAKAQVRVVRRALSVEDSSAARSGTTVVHWDSTSTSATSAQGLSAGDEVVVAQFGRTAVSNGGRVVASWADGTTAASETQIGTGCIRNVGVAIPVAGDLALHAPYQRIVRRLTMPCGESTGNVALDSASVRRLVGTGTSAASASALRNSDAPPTPIVKWMLALALLLGVAELFVRAQMKPQVAA